MKIGVISEALFKNEQTHAKACEKIKKIGYDCLDYLFSVAGLPQAKFLVNPDKNGLTISKKSVKSSKTRAYPLTKRTLFIEVTLTPTTFTNLHLWLLNS
jgi:hypothetical protein